MLEQLEYQKVNLKKQYVSYGKGDMSMGLVTAFAVVAVVTIVIYKIYGSKTGDITLPGGFKFKFTT